MEQQGISYDFRIIQSLCYPIANLPGMIEEVSTY